MARIIFLGILLLNIGFFFWEQKKGAPEIYLPVYDTQQSGRQYPEKILLAREAPARAVVIKNAQSQKVDIQQQNADLLREANQALQANQVLLAKHKAEQQQGIEESHNEQSLDASSAVVAVSESVASEGELNVTEPVTGLEVISPVVVEEATLVPVVEELVTEQPAAVIVATENTEASLISKTEPIKADKAVAKVVLSEPEVITPSVPVPVVKQEITIVEACYQLKTGKYTKAKIKQKISKSNFELQLFEQKQHQINSTYWVLTQAESSLKKAKAVERKIKKLGITDYWLFRKGDLQWQLSLGLFSNIERANRAKRILAKRTGMTLDIKPRKQAITVTHIKVSGAEKQQMKAFEKQFSKLIDHELGCYNGEF